MWVGFRTLAKIDGIEFTISTKDDVTLFLDYLNKAETQTQSVAFTDVVKSDSVTIPTIK